MRALRTNEFSRRCHSRRYPADPSTWGVLSLHSPESLQGRNKPGCREHTTGRRGSTNKQSTYVSGVSRMREGSMRALCIVPAVIGLAILIFAHATVLGIVSGIAFVGLAVFPYRRPLVHRIG